MKKILFVLLFCPLVLWAENNPEAEKEVHQVMTQLKKQAYQADFILDYYAAESASHSPMDGSMVMQKTQFSLIMNGIQTLYDGETQWVFMAKENEVTITTPDEEDLEQINPWMMVNHYYKTHRIDYGDKISQLKTMYFFFPPDLNEEYFKKELVVMNKTKLPCSLKIYQKNGDYILLSWSDMRPLEKQDISAFQFQKVKYPHVVVNDMR